MGNGEWGTIITSLLLLLLMVLYPMFSGLVLILALLVLGSISLIFKSANVKLMGLGAMIVLALLNILLMGGFDHLRYGIDFSGGVRIPVLLEKSVDHNTMEQMISILKTRTSILGLTQPSIKALGNSLIYIEIPGGSEKQIAYVKDVLSHQGVFLGLVDGNVAVSGDSIYPSSIRRQSYRELQYEHKDWGVSFSITYKAAQGFGKIVYGKAGYPVYLFIDRPKHSIIVAPRTLILNATYDDKSLLSGIKDAGRLANNSIDLYLLSSKTNYTAIVPTLNTTNMTYNITALVPNSLDNDSVDSLKSKGYLVKKLKDDYFKPAAYQTQRGLVVNKWKCIGLMDAPTLSKDLTTGKRVSQSYSIGGAVQSTASGQKSKLARQNEQEIVSILKGGALPVSISIGSATDVPPSLGKQFKTLSIIGIIASILAIAAFVSIRYRHLKATLAIVAISLSELIVLISILGSFTIDLAAMAGIIAAIGVGVDSQIVITDEILKEDRDVEEGIHDAFEIIGINVTIVVFTMMPLLFSGLVEIIGFAISTILGALLGYLLSRPAYAVLVEKIIE